MSEMAKLNLEMAILTVLCFGIDPDCQADVKHLSVIKMVYVELVLLCVSIMVLTAASEK